MINLQFQFSHCNVDYRICQLAFTDCNVIIIIFVIFVFDFIYSKYQADYNSNSYMAFNYKLLYRNISPFCEPLSFVQELHFN